MAVVLEEETGDLLLKNKPRTIVKYEESDLGEH
jgi:hypothetical protein